MLLKKHRTFCKCGLTHLSIPTFKNCSETYGTPCIVYQNICSIYYEEIFDEINLLYWLFIISLGGGGNLNEKDSGISSMSEMASSTNIVVVDDLEQPQLKQQQQPPQQLPEVLTTSKSAGKIYEAPPRSFCLTFCLSIHNVFHLLPFQFIHQFTF